MRLPIALVLASAGIVGCDAPTAPDPGRLAPETHASEAARGPIASVAGSAEFVPGKAGETTRVTLNARALADGTATGRFRIDTPTETITGIVECLEVNGSDAVASGRLDESKEKKRGLTASIFARDVSSSSKLKRGDAVNYSVGILKKAPGACGITKVLPQPVTHGNFVIRGATGGLGSKPSP